MILGLDGSQKMSKSRGNAIMLSATEDETAKLIEAIDKTKSSYNILLDLKGKQMDSVELANTIEDLKDSGLRTVEDLNFIIGG